MQRKGGPDSMEESTTINLAKILSNIDSTNEMEQYMENPGSCGQHSELPGLFPVLGGRAGDGQRELIRNSGLERSYYYQVMKGT